MQFYQLTKENKNTSPNIISAKYGLKTSPSLKNTSKNIKKNMMKLIKLILLFFIVLSCNSQKKFQIIYLNDNYRISYIADRNRNVIKKLDSSYSLNYQPETLGYFSIFSIQGEEGWTAIDINEKKLFKVYNTEIGTPSPDDIIENRIRIVDSKDKIGFGDKKGNIVIQPQFEMASSFHNGKAMIAEKCEKIPWETLQKNHGDCEHYSIVCKKHGYINKKGEILKFGDYTFEQIQKEIGWKNP
ncbi:WG repeat-containing protein [Chryseobacterium oryctis]|uniref:WG repeat-containing protein n=1 Tax=Chryseobacterium oryctis TaxID=2952618 RepID=A0ABT3HPK1_9FLAO|nr:WG repeat-containing protein [Chryseobacterium oryctis]MCW3161706.1 WG repeat-containing protein [Chryseobacterium oryctis]